MAGHRTATNRGARDKGSIFPLLSDMIARGGRVSSCTCRQGSSAIKCVLGCQANLRGSSKIKELAKLRLQVLVVVKANDAYESKKEIMRHRE